MTHLLSFVKRKVGANPPFSPPAVATGRCSPAGRRLRASLPARVTACQVPTQTPVGGGGTGRLRHSRNLYASAYLSKESCLDAGMVEDGRIRCIQAVPGGRVPVPSANTHPCSWHLAPARQMAFDPTSTASVCGSNRIPRRRLSLRYEVFIPQWAWPSLRAVWRTDAVGRLPPSRDARRSITA